MLPFISRYRALFAAIVFVAAAGPAWAQNDPPDRVARLNYISGQVSFRPASLEEWGVAPINYPLTTGDHLWTEPRAAAELHVGAAVLRLAPETAFSFLNLDNDVVQMRVAEGTLDLRVREILEGEIYEVDTPNAAISILSPGIYHIDVDPEGDRTRVTVRAGRTEIDAAGRVFAVYAGQMAEIIGVEDAIYDVGRAASPDRWELWCRDRDRREDNRLALTYVSRDMIGYEDLDDYGTWTYVPEYGYGWEPTVVAVDWAPYRYGRWAWVKPWGWTWIDEARWGFAPFHYGRWTCYRNRWIWLPGQRHSQPVWAPALVAFVGDRDWKFPFAGGNRSAVGWFPLGPGEVYCPSYRASTHYLRNVNMPDVKLANVNLTAIDVARTRYANRDVHGAMTAVPRETFVAAQSVNRAGIAVPRSVAAQTAVLGHGVAVKPDVNSVIGPIPAAAARPPVAVMNRGVVARAEPSARGSQTMPVIGRRPLPQNAKPQDPYAQGVRQPTQQPAWSSERPATAAAPRNEQPTPDKTAGASGGRPAASAPRNEAPSYQAPRYEPPRPQAVPRDERPAQNPGGFAPKDERPAANPGSFAPKNEGYQAPRNQYEPARPQAAPREERPAPNSGTFAPKDDRPAAGGGMRAPSSERPAPREERVERPSSPPPSARPEPAKSEPPKSEAPKSDPPKSDPGGKPGGGRGGKN